MQNEYWEEINNNKLGNYAIYLRKSRADIEAEQRGEEETLVRHKKILEDLAEKRGYTIKKIYKEIVSRRDNRN